MPVVYQGAKSFLSSSRHLKHDTYCFIGDFSRGGKEVNSATPFCPANDTQNHQKWIVSHQQGAKLNCTKLNSVLELVLTLYSLKCLYFK